MNNGRRIKGVSLMGDLQPLTQSGAITAATARGVVASYMGGEDGPLKALLVEPGIPVFLSGILKRIREKYLQ